jgi:tetratricopeptide (TPR) repeat protein
MGQVLFAKILPTLNNINWPESPSLTELGRETFEVGVDKVNEYRGDPRDLASALRTFQSGDSRPYAFAGAAYALVIASREKDGSYAIEGLEAALDWLEMAQALEPDVVAINVIEGLIYIYSGRFDDARLILDYLGAQEPNSYEVLRAEAIYWEHRGDLANAVQAYEKAIEAADSVPRKLRLRHSLGDCYLHYEQDDRALEVYREVIHFDRENPRLWHNMSLAYFHKEDFEEAERCNSRSLTLGQLPEALQLQEALKDRLDSGGIARRLFGR